MPKCNRCGDIRGVPAGRERISRLAASETREEAEAFLRKWKIEVCR